MHFPFALTKILFSIIDTKFSGQLLGMNFFLIKELQSWLQIPASMMCHVFATQKWTDAIICILESWNCGRNWGETPKASPKYPYMSHFNKYMVILKKILM